MKTIPNQKWRESISKHSKEKLRVHLLQLYFYTREEEEEVAGRVVAKGMALSNKSKVASGLKLNEELFLSMIEREKETGESVAKE